MFQLVWIFWMDHHRQSTGRSTGRCYSL